MLVDGGASINLMPYTTFRKLGKGLEDLMETDMMLKDFEGNTSKTWGVKGSRCPRGGVNWANSKFSCNNQILRIAQLTPCAQKSVYIKLMHNNNTTYVPNLLQHDNSMNVKTSIELFKVNT